MRHGISPCPRSPIRRASKLSACIHSLPIKTTTPVSFRSKSHSGIRRTSTKRRRPGFGGLGLVVEIHSHPFTDEDRMEVETEFQNLMADAVVVEALVSHADASFNVDAFVQPDPSQPEGHWQVAWNEKSLRLTGRLCMTSKHWGRLRRRSSFGSSSSSTSGGPTFRCIRATGSLRCRRFSLFLSGCGAWHRMSCRTERF